MILSTSIIIIILSVINSSSKPQHFTMDYVECPCASTARLCFVWKIAKYFISLRISRRYSHLKIPYRLQGHLEANNTCVRQVAHNFFENKYEMKYGDLKNWWTERTITMFVLTTGDKNYLAWLNYEPTSLRQVTLVHKLLWTFEHSILRQRPCMIKYIFIMKILDRFGI